MKRSSALLFALAAVALSVSNMQASLVPVGDPFPANSWGQAFTDTIEPNFNHVEGVMVSGTTFENPGFIALDGGWASTYNTPTLIAASGLLVTGLNWTTMFNNPTTAIWDFNLYNDSTAVASYRLYYGVAGGALDIGAGWRLDILDTASAPSPVPEPTTVVAGALLLLPFAASTIRILRKRTV